MYGFSPNSAAVAFYYPLANCKTYACSRVFICSMLALEYLEKMTHELRGYAYSIIFHRENPIVFFSPGRDTDTRRLLSSEFDGITDKILEQLNHL